MHCSSCMTKLRPVVAVDIDGTLGDYHGHLIAFAERYLGRVLPINTRNGYDGSEPHRDWFCRIAKIDVRTFRDIKLAYRQGAQKRCMPIFAGAVEGMKHLQELGAEIWITTTRPYLRLDGIDPDTREWLERHKIPYDHLLYDDDKYSVLASRVEPDRVVAVIDDIPEMYDEAAINFGNIRARLVDRPHNQASQTNARLPLNKAFDWAADNVTEWITHAK